MKHLINKTIAMSLCITIMPSLIVAQDLEKTVFEYDNTGNVKSVYFSKADKEHEQIKSSDVFFRDILKTSDNDQFIPNKAIRLDKGNETFEQYYKGIKVENAGYTFHYDENGCMRYAHGNYVNIPNLNINPVISKEDAYSAFAKYKGISPATITDSSAELTIKEIKEGFSIGTPLLVYKIYVESSKAYITEYGYVDAMTGRVVQTESFIKYTEPVGTFHTKYYGTKNATTYLYNGSYYLRDITRCIETDNLNGHTPNGTNYATPISDSDNNWFYSDFSDSTFMALDVHWALQKIYDRLYDAHGKNSMDNHGKSIYAFVNAWVYTEGIGYNPDNACWNENQKKLFFGGSLFSPRPHSSLDIVSHELGHGITSYQIGWSNNEDYLEEGLSDIWGAIMDFRFGDANTEIWKQGEHITSLSCIRDLSCPLSSNAVYQMADTYNSTYYQSFVNNNEATGLYEKSGVFSHWFYLLVNGGQGYNANGKYYILSPVGMDVAENLIVKAVYDNYLRHTTSYPDVRNAFIRAAQSMNIDGLVAAVCNAWYAVGVGEMYLSLSGPPFVCSTGAYSISNLPSGYTVSWSISDNYYNNGYNLLIPNYPTTGHCLIIRDDDHDLSNATLTAAIKYNGVTMQTLTMEGIYAYDGFRGHYISGNISSDIDYTYILHVTPNYNTIITSYNFLGASVSYSSSGTTPLYWGFSPTSGEIDVTMPSNNNNVPIVFNIDDVCGNQYTLYLFPTSYNNMNIVNSDNSITVTLSGNSETSKAAGFDQPWTVEIRNVTSGELIETRSSTNQYATISTLGWQKGMYVVKVTLGNESWNEKIVKN